MRGGMLATARAETAAAGRGGAALGAFEAPGRFGALEAFGALGALEAFGALGALEAFGALEALSDFEATGPCDSGRRRLDFRGGGGTSERGFDCDWDAD